MPHGSRQGCSLVDAEFRHKRGHLPLSLSLSLCGVPLALRLVIERCLMKEPRSRYQRVAEVAAALDAIRRRRAWPLVGPLLVSVRRQSLLWQAGVILGGVAMLLAGNGLWRWVGEGR